MTGNQRLFQINCGTNICHSFWLAKRKTIYDVTMPSTLFAFLRHRHFFYNKKEQKFN